MSIADIKNMSTKERLETMELLWDSLREESSSLDSPTWHEDILKKRKSIIDSGDAEFLSTSDLKKELN